MRRNENIERAGRNRTLSVSIDEQQYFGEKCLLLTDTVASAQLENQIVQQDLFAAIPFLPHGFVDLLFLDPPYNLTKVFNEVAFKQSPEAEYSEWFSSWFVPLLNVLKPDASVYICTDWRTSAVVYPVLSQYLTVRNRITWEREKGRGAARNWKNNSEDIWFCTRSNDYTFNVDAVKVKRKVIAPYRQNGIPKDWQSEAEGDFRLTAPSNLWTDITIPFWSMPENTDHPTQKPEKLVAKTILASTNTGDLVLDPFAGSGTTPVTAKKLGRRYTGIEIDPLYCAVIQKRLALSEANSTIQGYTDGIFWERNSQPQSSAISKKHQDLSLF